MRPLLLAAAAALSVAPSVEGRRLTRAQYVAEGRIFTADGTVSSAHAAYGGRSGHHDAATNVMRWLTPAKGVMTNVASVFGPWFAWREQA